MDNTTLPVGESVDLTTVQQLAEAVHMRLGAIEAFTGYGYTDARRDVMTRAHEVVDELRACRLRTVNPGFEWHAILQANAVCHVLFGELHPPAQFWMTPLGADVAWLIGYPHSVVPVWAAAAVCNLNRSVASTAVKEGRLVLTPAGVRDYVRRYPRWTRWAKTLQPDASTMQPVAPAHSWDVGKLTRRTAVQPA
jgi:hypothetical protein